MKNGKLGLKKIEIIALSVCFIISPALVSADTVPDLRSQINSLLAQVRELQQKLHALQMASSTMASSTSRHTIPAPPGLAKRCLHITRAVGFGQRGDDVGELQKFLTDEGHFPQGMITGFFGHATEQALKRFQAAHGIIASGTPQTTGWGVLGPATRGLLRQGCEKKPINCPVYMPRPCKADETLVAGKMLPNGCQASARCTRNEDSNKVKGDKHDDDDDDVDVDTASSTPAVPVVINSFSLSSTTVALGSAVTVNWQTSGATRCLLYSPSSEKRNVADEVATSGPTTIIVSQKESDFERGKDATVTLVCFGANLEGPKHFDSAATTSVVHLIAASQSSSASAPMCKLEADKETVKGDKKVKLAWSSTNATSSMWANGDSAPLYGRKNIEHVATTTTYSLTFFGAGGQTTCSTTVTVEPGKPKNEVSDAGTVSNLASALIALETGLTSLLDFLGQ